MQQTGRTIPTETFYTSTESLSRLFDKNVRKLRFQGETAEAFRTWKQEAAAQLKKVTGMDQMEYCDLEPRILGTEQMDGYRREKWLIQTEPDVWMPFYILLPDGIAEGETRPAMIAPHGHGSAGKYSPASRTDIPAVAEAVENYNYGYGLRFVQEGYIVFCPDARGFGERREWMLQGEEERAFLNSTCVELNHIAISLGRSLTGMWTWDLIRLVDYIETRTDCTPGKIGCAGLSGGGLQTLWLAALDERVQCAVVSGYFYGYKDSLLKYSYNCGCNYVPSLWNHVDMGDLGAMIAPRPLLIETGNEDGLNGDRGLQNVTEQLEITRDAYSVWGQENRLQHHIFEGRHRWDGKETYPFVDRWLK
ncbi:dienelactone hydrolase family protein [Paenibacillus solisilvae]|uniref:Dienelactone hydrolase family protein n=1 Tax=Paenibacillus solisilvae TaxID=2486751 RepID=A0ABW0W574_9BACL